MLTTGGQASGSIDVNTMDISDFVDLGKVNTDVGHPFRPYKASNSTPTTTKRKIRCIDSQADYDMAQFQYVEVISTLQDSRDTSSSRTRRGEV
jgi:hypothetical protein